MFEENILEGGFTDFEDDLITGEEEMGTGPRSLEDDEDGVDFESYDDEDVDW